MPENEGKEKKLVVRVRKKIGATSRFSNLTNGMTTYVCFRIEPPVIHYLHKGKKKHGNYSLPGPNHNHSI